MATVNYWKNFYLFLIVIISLKINAQQQSSEPMQKTFANTQFDLDPNLPSEDFSSIVSLSTLQFSNSSQQFLGEIPAQTSTTLRLVSATEKISEAENLQANLPNNPLQYFQKPSFPAPRAKVYRNIAEDIAISVSAINPPAAQHESAPMHESSNSAFQELKLDKNNAQYFPVDIQVTPRLPYSIKGYSSPKYHASHSALKSPKNLSTSQILNLPAAPSATLTDNKFKSEIPAQRISSALLWFSQTLPSFGILSYL
ncbi:unnamed protein product [Thelazia callipaeda]|uniref:AMIN domain-containing protein n=1 Tax=Thelazia callipaeda TaxID=103827 RepID=A0A0N5CP36_THECL|nr:unnamed protein product [Thelazia callipaeda]